ncbi:MAG TPA: SpoIID/LytB domain-containing protein [Myxococcota bacterium]|nr:SpoIID/LytB domain-containing protein [Myxococcota bacterium]HRY94530.1 SpoIID/LytB domain-containing protein [Myxococcota bacterium]HSA20029.1 SpoIID/LytB domain-containing protein [Myxococcota bacterium]
MTAPPTGQEPRIEVGLLDGVAELALRLEGAFRAADGSRAGPGELRLQAGGPGLPDGAELRLEPEEPGRAAFALEATIGIDFHWQQRELQRFQGGLRVLARRGRLTLVNTVPLETYLRSVIGSEMNAASPPALARAHAIISRSWLLAQLAGRGAQARAAAGMLDEPGELRRWTDRQAHADFDVCADDHCQRYQGLSRVAPAAAEAIAATRGVVLTHGGAACDARFSKCCGGVSEDFRTAWGDEPVPYLVPVRDQAGPAGPLPGLETEPGLRAFLSAPPAAYCAQAEPHILARVLNSYDLGTRDFFRWRVRLPADEAGRLVRERVGRDLGRLLALEPLARGPSGRLHRLRLRGERGELVLGKELLIRRALSDSHLLSSAFAVDAEGPAARPEAFVLRGAGWGHGVGLCQIGAAVMACQGHAHEAILAHYYPGTALARCYP